MTISAQERPRTFAVPQLGRLPSTARASEYILKLRCPDRPGVIAAVTEAVFRMGCDIRASDQFGDADTGTYFFRIHLSLATGRTIDELKEEFAGVAAEQRLEANWHSLERKMRTVLAVSKQRHCLLDLLQRWKGGLLHTDVVGVISNHEDLRRLSEWHGVPFHYLPVDSETRKGQEAAILDLMSRERVDLLVLARYMQVLSDETSAKLSGRCINIHHSFLPAFKGAKPYHQAHCRGVKLIGATAHYVTPDLDEGPIIEQSVQRISHAATAEEMVDLGKDVEASVLARAVRWHVEHRVTLNGHKTIVFS